MNARDAEPPCGLLTEPIAVAGMVRGGQVEEFYLAVDSCITKPCGGDAAGRSALDRAKGGRRRSTVTEARARRRYHPGKAFRRLEATSAVSRRDAIDG
jgi:hypothetical protein